MISYFWGFFEVFADNFLFPSPFNFRKILFSGMKDSIKE